MSSLFHMKPQKHIFNDELKKQKNIQLQEKKAEAKNFDFFRSSAKKNIPNLISKGSGG